jgi:mannosyltransferase OCH1-like enzyme
MTDIPLIIHHIWLDRLSDENAHPPNKYLTPQYTMGIAEMNPDFAYRFWNVKAVKALFADSRLRRWKEFYLKLEDLIEQCDFLRYAILFIQGGGVYIDCDLTAIQALKHLVQRAREVVLVPNLTQCDVTLRHDRMTVPAAISNSVIGSVPNQHFWSELMDYIMYRYDKTTPVLYSTGPVAIGNFTQLMYYSIDDRTEWYISNRLVLWEEVPNSAQAEGF